MKKIMAIMTFLSVFFMMNLPVLADIPVDDSEYVRNETSYLPIVLSIGQEQDKINAAVHRSM